MERGSLQPAESSSLIPRPASPESETEDSAVLALGADGRQQRIPDIYRGHNEATVWSELDSKKHSAGYHLGQCFKYLSRARNGPGVLERAQALARRDDSDNTSKDGWRFKVEHDKAIRDLLALSLILDVLKTRAKGRSGATRSFSWVAPGLSLALFLSACLVHRARFGPIFAAGALTVAVGAGCGVEYLRWRWGYTGLRALAIDQCQQIVRSLDNSVRACTLNQEDCRSLGGSWFLVLNWYRVEDEPEEGGISPSVGYPTGASGASQQSRLAFHGYVEETSHHPGGSSTSEED